MKNRRRKTNPGNVPIGIILYAGTPNPRNPFDRLTPEERHKKIVEIYAQITAVQNISKQPFQHR